MRPICDGAEDAPAGVADDITNGRGLMETDVKQKIDRPVLKSSMACVSLAAALLCGLSDQCWAQTAKKITPDPYYSTLRQAQQQQSSSSSTQKSFYQSAWEPPKTATASTPARQAKIEKAQNEAEVWSSVARKTTKPVTRIDFSRLDAKPPKKADVSLPQITPQPLKPVGVNAVIESAHPLKSQALTPIKPPQSAEDLIKSAMAQSRSIIRQKNGQTQKAGNSAVTIPTATAPAAATTQAAFNPATFASAAINPAASTPIVNASPPAKAKALNSSKNPADFNMPRVNAKPRSVFPIVAQTSGADENVDATAGVASKIATANGDGSFVQQAAYEPQIGERIKKMVEKGVGTNRNAGSGTRGAVTEKTSGSNTRASVPEAAAGSGTRVADASNNFYTPNTISPPHNASPTGPVESGSSTKQSYQDQQQEFKGESFENSRVLALVGGHPVFVGDMMFEVNQILEKHMKGAPQAAKDAQKEKLMSRLLPKYIDQKMLFVSTLQQLPEQADIDDILKQAEVTFNEKALPGMMKNSGIDSVTKFDGILRSQGSSVRQVRRAWAKDQISKFFLQEKVQYNKQVTHLEMLDEYRSNFDQYEVKGKVRWEQIEIQPAKAGGSLAAQKKIEDIYDRLVHGGNFEAIAKKESHGFRAYKGGQYDWTSKGSLVNKEIDKSIFTLPQGKLSGIIETKAGFHIIRVIERVETHHTPFTEAQVEIKKRLLAARRDEAFRTYIDGLKDKINVEYINE